MMMKGLIKSTLKHGKMRKKIIEGIRGVPRETLNGLEQDEGMYKNV